MSATVPQSDSQAGSALNAVFAIPTTCVFAVLIQYMDHGSFDEALESLDSLIAEYTELEKSDTPNVPCDNAAALQLAF